MSLDVSLIGDEVIRRPESSGIFVRENGHTVEISEQEWARRYPDREPVRYLGRAGETKELYSANITHNLGKMAQKAGVYEALWRPEEKGWTHAKQLISPLEAGLADMKMRPDAYRLWNPKNGWGSYEGLIDFIENYLAACHQYPDAKIEVSR